MRRPRRSLIVLVAILLGLPAFLEAGAAPCGEAARAEQLGLNLSAFAKVAFEYSQLVSSRPREASQYLLCLEKRRNLAQGRASSGQGRTNSALAETLLLYQGRLSRPEEITNAFLYYVINTEHPILVGQEDIEVLERLKRTYQESIRLAPGWTYPGSPIVDLPGLRSFGQRANKVRYGRGDMLPIHQFPLVESAREYSDLNAAWMAGMADLAYWVGKRNPGADKGEESGDLVERQLQDWGYSNIQLVHDTETDTRAFLAAKDRHVVLSFKGTSSPKNWLTDATIGKVSPDWAPEWGAIPGGFAKALQGAWPEITNRLANPDLRQKEIWVTGHSLGAALAQLAALRLKHELKVDVRWVYTYGTPRIGDKTFVAEYDRRLGRQTFPHVNHNDLVTRVPPELLGFSPTANRQTREFLGKSHALKRRPQTLRTPRDPDELMNQARRQIQDAAAFVEAEEGPINLYATPAATKESPLGEHGAYEYLFKLGCVVKDEHFWRRERRRARN